jgi:hypothetical protein
VPSLVGRKAISCDTNLGSHHGLELVVGNFQEGQQLAYQHAYIALVDQCKAKVERSSPNTDIGIPQAIQYCVPVPLNSIGFDRNDLDQCVESDISDVVVPVR